MIENLRNEFIQEAKAAPKLFKDLAKVEQYIAESYKTRALIELMQNADDAGASKFGIHAFNKGFIVGNNGKSFTQNDVEALCRSGSSNKHRGGETIGYRGIGFKSVVNIANVVNIISGDFKFSFERKKTIQTLDNVIDVPLIRIPHIFSNEDIKLENEVTEIFSKFNYNTVFVFGNVIEEISREELTGLDRSSLLFLKNLNEVHIDYKDIHRNIFVKHNYDQNNDVVELIEDELVDEWKIQHSEKNKVDLVAYKIENNVIVPALSEESVIHSFTPTNEFSGAFIKINGDYTTDPSRKSVDMDDLSKKSYDNAVKIIVKNIEDILNEDLSKQGFFTPFINIQTTDSSRFKNLLFNAIEERKEEMLEDDNSHYLIYRVLGISNKRGQLIDQYQNTGRFLYKYAGSFLEEAAVLCFHFNNLKGKRTLVDNNVGSKPKTFEIDFLDDNSAIEIKWRDATTDGDHITKEHTRVECITSYGYKPIRVMFYYPQRTQAIKIQKILATYYKGVKGEYYGGDEAWKFIKNYTGYDLLKILTDIADKKTD